MELTKMLKAAGADAFAYGQKVMELLGECRGEVWTFGEKETEVVPVWKLPRGQDALEVARAALLKRAHVVVHLGEAWYARMTKEERDAVVRGEVGLKPASEREDRRECLSVAVAYIGGEMVCGHMQILRGEGNKLTGFGPIQWADEAGDVVESEVRIFKLLREAWQRGREAGVIRRADL